MNINRFQKAGVFVKVDEEPIFEEQIKAVFPKSLSSKKNSWHKKTEKKVDNTTFELPPLKRVQVIFRELVVMNEL